MRLDEVRSAVSNAKRDLSNADEAIGDMLQLCKGRLRHGSSGGGNYWVNEALAEIKAELRDFNAVTKCWKN